MDAPLAKAPAKLQMQAARLSKFLGGEWSAEKCAEYITSLTQDERRELWEDIDFQLKEEAAGRSGCQSLEEARLKAARNIDLVLFESSEPRQPCCFCGTRSSQSYRDAADPHFVLWMCDRCNGKHRSRIPAEMTRQRLRKVRRPSV